MKKQLFILTFITSLFLGNLNNFAYNPSFNTKINFLKRAFCSEIIDNKNILILGIASLTAGYMCFNKKITNDNTSTKYPVWKKITKGLLYGFSTLVLVEVLSRVNKSYNTIYMLSNPDNRWT